MGCALVQQSHVLIETELCMCTRGVIMGMHTAGYLGIWQPCKYCRVQLNYVVHMHDMIWQGSGGCQGCWGAMAGRVHAKQSYPVYDLGGYAHSSKSDVSSVLIMVDYI
jgi:hypothetical protein